MLTDLRFAFRMFRRSPGFAAVAVATLALGIGATTAVFSVVDTIVLRPLPYADPERLVSVISTRPGRDASLSAADFVDWQAQARSFEYLAAYGETGLTVTGAGDPEPVRGIRVSWTLLPALGIEPVVGRGFRPEDDRAGAPPVVLITHEYWQRRFGGDPGAIGRTLVLDPKLYTIAGVLPRQFRFPEFGADIAVPAAFGAEELSGRGAHYLSALGRLKPGVSREAAEAEMRVIARRLEEQYPDTNPARSARVAPLHEYLVGPVRRALLLLLGAISLVLLIACTNVSNLLLARNTVRSRELAVRVALGAGRLRLAQQLVVEALMLSLGGSLAGILLAWWGIDLLGALAPEEIRRFAPVLIDARVLVFAVGAGVLAGVLAAAAPTLRFARLNPGDPLRDAGRASTGGPSGLRTRRLLTAGEIALALVLLVAAGLLLQSFVRIQRVHPGFVADRLLTGRIELPTSRYDGERQWRDFYRRLETELGSLPTDTGIIEPLPMSGGVMRTAVRPLDRSMGPTELPVAAFRIVSPGYFETMGIPVLTGRIFSDSDVDRALTVLVVNQTMARQIWPGEDPVGKRIWMGWDDLTCEVIGVVGDVRHQAPHRDPGPEMYVPFAQIPYSAFHLVLRPRNEATDLRRDVQAILARIDPALPFYDVRGMNERIAETAAHPRFYTTVVTAFALVAVALAMMGLYGLIAFSVANQTREIGVRLALGAAPRDIYRLVIGEGMWPVVLGVAVGAAGAAGAARLLESLLFETQPTDWATFATVAATLALTGLAAAFFPARRATRVDATAALRAE